MLRRAKSNYYHSVLNEHKGNSKKAWETVNELIYNKKRSSSPPFKLMNSNGVIISNPLAIAEEFNECFTNVGKTMATLLPTVGSNNSKNIVFSKNKASNSIFLSPCSPQEVYHLINQLKEEKAKRASDIETKFIKYANPVLSYFVSDTFNRCLTEGVYPDSLKIAEVIPILRKETATKQQIIDQFHCCHNLTKFLKSCCILEYTLT